jgi:AraC-binding-like domain
LSRASRAAAAAVFSSSIAFSTRSRIGPLPVAAPRWLAFCTALDGSFDQGTKGTGVAAIIGSSEAVMTRFSVVPIPPQQRSAHWSSFVSGIFFPMSASFSAPEKFYGTIDNWELGQISLSRFDSAPVCYDRAKQHLRGSSENDLLITFATKSSARFIQGHNVLHCKKDGFFIQRGDLPYQSSHAENNELWVLKLPAQMLKSRIRVFDRYLSYVYDSSRGAGALFLDTARGIPRRMAAGRCGQGGFGAVFGGIAVSGARRR